MGKTNINGILKGIDLRLKSEKIDFSVLTGQGHLGRNAVLRKSSSDESMKNVDNIDHVFVWHV